MNDGETRVIIRDGKRLIQAYSASRIFGLIWEESRDAKAADVAEGRE